MLRIAVVAVLAIALAFAALAAGAAPRPGDVTCYTVSGPPPAQEAVVARDQLGSQRTKLTALTRLCKPARRGSSRAGRANFSCYRLRPQRTLRRSFTVENAFGQQTLAATRADSLCLPATAGPSALELVRGRDPVTLADAYACYSVTAASFRRRTVVVSDSFGAKRRVSVLKPSLLCASAEVRRGKHRMRARNSEDRLVCYAVAPVAAPGRKTLVLNELGLFELRVGRLAVLCLASTKAAPPPAQQFTLTVIVTGMGSVQSSPAGIGCPADCDEAYAAGTRVTLTSTGPAAWTGCDSTTATSCIVTMSKDRAVTAAVTHALAPWPFTATAPRPR